MKAIIICLIFLLFGTGCKNSSVERETNISKKQVPPIVNPVKNVNMDKKDKYEQIVSSYDSLSTQDLLNENFNKPLFILFGYSSCPYCQDFAPILDKTFNALERKPQLYYCDVDPKNKNNSIDNISACFHIEGVPTLIHISDENEMTFYEEDIVLEEWFQSFTEK